jgi:hypothetical protein
VTDYSEQGAGKPDGSETAVPAGTIGMMERAGCRCAEMMPKMMAMCAGSEQEGEVAEPVEAAATGPEEEVDP